MTSKETSVGASTKEPQSTPKKQPKKRRWLRRLGWLVVFLGILTFLVNGIVARKVVHHYLNKSLEDQGMTGSVEIYGTILSGFEVKNLRYTGDEGIQSLNIDEVTVDYQIMQLMDLKIDDLTVTNLITEIDIAKFKPSETTTESKDWKQTLKDLRPMIMHPEIGLDDLDITVLKEGKKMLHWKLGSIQHGSETDEIKFNQWTISDSDTLSTPEQSATLVWNDANITFDRLQLLPELTLEAISFDWKSDLKGDASLKYRSAEIDVDIAENASLKLREGEIRSEEIFKTLTKFGVTMEEIDMDAVLNELDVKIPVDDFKSAVPLWKIDGSLGIESARWETYNIENTSLSIAQDKQNYQVNINGTAIGAPLKLDINSNWEKSSAEKWWESTTAKVSFQTQVNDKILALIPELESIPKEISISNSKIGGEINTQLVESKLELVNGEIEISGMTVKGSPLPPLALSAKYAEENIKFKIKPLDTSVFKLEGNIKPDSQQYDATFQANTVMKDSPWINALAEAFKSPITLNDSLDIQWKGEGNLDTKIHDGTLKTKNLTLKQKDQDPVTVNLESSYDWPKSLVIKTLSAEQKELFAEVSMQWDGKDITIKNSQIKRDNEPIGSITGKLPFTADIDTSKKFFAQTEPWEITIDTEELNLKRLTELIPASQDLKLEGTLQTKLNIAGSPRTPEMNGNIDIKGMNDVLELGLEKISLNTKLDTKDNLLNVKGNLTENDTQRIAIDLELPFTPHQWLEDDNLLETIKKNSELKGTAEIKQLPLGRFTKLIPELEKFEGLLDAKAEFKGTIAEPKYKIDFNAKLPIVKLKDAGVDDITDITIEGTLDQSMILNSEINAKLNGGKFLTKIKVDVNDPKMPVFDVNLITDHALVYRDDMLAMRANVDLKAKGTIDDATVTGSIGILESLFYKDVDLIPIGVPSSAVGDVKLPSLNTKAKQTLPIPAPFDKWKLELTVKTVDPILIRGNVGTGRIEGEIKVRGTLAEPSLDGTLFAKKVKAKLPFSVLNVSNGKIIFTPSNGLIPTLDIRGKSQVGVNNVSIYAYGSADDPKITLSSYPALPENEIMTLLATGTTNSGLADRDVATFKTLQILLLELKQRSDRPGGNRLFSKILSGIDDLELKVGELNELTGEKYASATVKLHKRWYLTAQIDNDQPPQTRGLVIFALRFR